MPVPSMGWFAICTDVEGNEFGLWQHGSERLDARRVGGSSVVRDTSVPHRSRGACGRT